MNLLLLIIFLLASPSKGDIYQVRVAKLIDCQIHGRLKQCEQEMRKEGMSERDLRQARRDVRNALK